MKWLSFGWNSTDVELKNGQKQLDQSVQSLIDKTGARAQADIDAQTQTSLNAQRLAGQMAWDGAQAQLDAEIGLSQQIGLDMSALADGASASLDNALSAKMQARFDSAQTLIIGGLSNPLDGQKGVSNEGGSLNLEKANNRNGANDYSDLVLTQDWISREGKINGMHTLATDSHSGDISAGDLSAVTGLALGLIQKFSSDYSISLKLFDRSSYFSQYLIQSGGSAPVWLQSSHGLEVVSNSSEKASQALSFAKAAPVLDVAGKFAGVFNVLKEWYDIKKNPDAGMADWGHLGVNSVATIVPWFVADATPWGAGFSVLDLGVSHMSYTSAVTGKPVTGWRAFIGIEPRMGADPRWSTQPWIMIGK